MRQNLHSFTHLHKICESAAKKIHYPLVIEHLHNSLEEQYWGLAEATVMYFLPRAILDLDTKLERREALDSIPVDGHITGLRMFVENGILALWEHERQQVA